MARFFCLLAAIAALAPATYATTEKSEVMIASLRQEIRMRDSNEFSKLLSRWEKKYSTQAVEPLLSIAHDSKTDDPIRYIALMGAARLGGQGSAPRLAPLLKDSSWMIRSAALRALTAVGARESAFILPLLKDPALVVRLEAVHAIEKLKPAGAEEALLAALRSPANYHAGKAQWVPQKALDALARLKAQPLAPELRPLLDHSADPALQAKTIETLEALTGKNLLKDRPLKERIAAWKHKLTSL